MGQAGHYGGAEGEGFLGSAGGGVGYGFGHGCENWWVVLLGQ